MLKEMDTVQYTVQISSKLQEALEQTRTGMAMDHEAFLAALLDEVDPDNGKVRDPGEGMAEIRHLLDKVAHVVEDRLRTIDKSTCPKPPSSASPDSNTPGATASGSVPASLSEDAEIAALITKNRKLERKLKIAEEDCLRAKDDIQQLQTEVYLTENIHSQSFRQFKKEKEKEFAGMVDALRRDCDNRIKFARAEERILAEKRIAELRRQVERMQRTASIKIAAR